ncbi:MAG: ParB N-terminal domain-containing protein [Cystobacterineae bacterium]|nr:ParB N-terminal domain-containing protein [Cystobacterineae bacterium]
MSNCDDGMKESAKSPGEAKVSAETETDQELPKALEKPSQESADSALALCPPAALLIIDGKPIADELPAKTPPSPSSPLATTQSSPEEMLQELLAEALHAKALRGDVVHDEALHGDVLQKELVPKESPEEPPPPQAPEAFPPEAMQSETMQSEAMKEGPLPTETLSAETQPPAEELPVETEPPAEEPPVEELPVETQPPVETEPLAEEPSAETQPPVEELPVETQPPAETQPQGEEALQETENAAVAPAEGMPQSPSERPPAETLAAETLCSGVVQTEEGQDELPPATVQEALSVQAEAMQSETMPSEAMQSEAMREGPLSSEAVSAEAEPSVETAPQEEALSGAEEKQAFEAAVVDEAFVSSWTARQHVSPASLDLECIELDETFRLRKKDESISALAVELARLGQLTPIDVRLLPSNRFQLITGFRRVEALRFLLRDKVVARIHMDLSDTDAWLLALASSIHATPASKAALMELQNALEKTGKLRPVLRDMLERALISGAGDTAEASEEVDADELAMEVAMRIAALNQDLSLVADVFSELEPSKRAMLLKQLRYANEMLAYLERLK